MSPAALLALCAPLISPVTMSAVVQNESSGNPLAIHDNTSGKSYAPRSMTDAIATAKRLIARRHSIDLGLAQINSKNLNWLHLTVEKSFDACENLKASQQVLLDANDRAGGDLKKTLQIYNSGQASGGQYAAAVFSKAGVVVPAIPGGKMASWTAKDVQTQKSEPVYVAKVSWTPAASAFAPDDEGFSVKW